MTLVDSRDIRASGERLYNERRRLNGKALALWQFSEDRLSPGLAVLAKTHVPFLVRVNWTVVRHDIDWVAVRHNTALPMSFKTGAYVSWTESWCRVPRIDQGRVGELSGQLRNLLSYRGEPGPIHFFVLEHLCSRPTFTPGGSSATT